MLLWRVFLQKSLVDVRKLDYDIFKNESWNDNIHPYLENQEIH